MAQFGGNKNPPWAQGGRGGQPGGGAGALDVPGLVGAFGAAAQGPPVFQGNPAGLPPGLAGVGHPLGVQGHGPAVTLAAAMAGQPVSNPKRDPRSGKLRNFSLSALFTFFVVSFSHYLGCLSKSSWPRWISRGARTCPHSAGSTPSPTPGDASATTSTPTARPTSTSTATWNRSEGFHRHGHQIARQFWLCRRRRFLPDFCG